MSDQEFEALANAAETAYREYEAASATNVYGLTPADAAMQRARYYESATRAGRLMAQLRAAAKNRVTTP